MSLFEQEGSVIRPVDFGEAGSGFEATEEQQVKETTGYVALTPGGVREGRPCGPPLLGWLSELLFHGMAPH